MQYFQKVPDLQPLLYFGFYRIIGGIYHGQKLLYAGGGYASPNSPSLDSPLIQNTGCALLSPM